MKPMNPGSRISGIDFWRGVVLIAILVDHIPGNLLEFCTPRNFGFSDSAEAFVFLSGLSVGAAYFPQVCKSGLNAVVRRCGRRALKIYAIHLAISFAALGIFAVGYIVSGAPELIQAHGRGFVFEKPAHGAFGLLLLSHQIGYFNILPLYVALMLWSPLALAIARKAPALALLTSVCIYTASRVLGLYPPKWPEPGGWFFNPFAWQLLFTLGMVASITWKDWPPRRNLALEAISAALLVGGAIVVTDGAHFSPGLWDAAARSLDLAKQNLGLGRLAHFGALAYVVATASRLAPMMETGFGRAMQRLGRHSLEIFAIGSLLTAIGQTGLISISGLASPGVERAIGIAYTMAGVVLLIVLANHWESRKRTGAESGPYVPPGGALRSLASF